MGKVLYALAVRQAAGLGEVSDGFFWHVGSARASSFKLEKFPGGVEGAIQTAIAHAWANVSDPDHCPASGFCWRFTP